MWLLSRSAEFVRSHQAEFPESLFIQSSAVIVNTKPGEYEDTHKEIMNLVHLNYRKVIRLICFPAVESAASSHPCVM